MQIHKLLDAAPLQRRERRLYGLVDKHCVEAVLLALRHENAHLVQG